MQSMHYTRQQGGFTLVELIVVLVILGILIAMASANLGRSDDARFTQVKSFVSDLQEAAMAWQERSSQRLGDVSPGALQSSNTRYDLIDAGAPEPDDTAWDVGQWEVVNILAHDSAYPNAIEVNYPMPMGEVVGREFAESLENDNPNVFHAEHDANNEVFTFRLLVR